MIARIHDMRMTPRLASAAAATVITALMLVCVGLGFPGPAAAGDSARATTHASVGVALTGRFE